MKKLIGLTLCFLCAIAHAQQPPIQLAVLSTDTSTQAVAIRWAAAQNVRLEWASPNKGRIDDPVHTTAALAGATTFRDSLAVLLKEAGQAHFELQSIGPGSYRVISVD